MKQLFSQPLLHYKHHFFLSSFGLYFVFLIYGSVTFWEVLLFYIAAYLPIIDEFLYAVLHYVDSSDCRQIVNHFFVGNVTPLLDLLHNARLTFKTLPLHNFASYTALWFLWYAFFIFDFAPGLYFLTGMQIHLFFDLLNDFYEYGNLNHWLWPITWQ